METPTLEQTPKMVHNLLLRLEGFERNITDLLSNDKELVEKPIGIAEAGEYLGRSNQTLYKDVQAGTIPHYKKGGKLYFLKSELLEWVKSGKIKSAGQIMEDLDNKLSRRS